MSKLEDKQREWAEFRKIVIPVSLVFMVIALANAVNFGGGSQLFPDAIRPLLLPAFGVGFLLFFPLAVRQSRLLKEMKELESE